MSRLLFASLAFGLVFCHAVSAEFWGISKREHGLLERLLNVLRAEETQQEPTCSIKSVDDLFVWCYGRHCLNEIFNKTCNIDVGYVEGEYQLKYFPIPDKPEDNRFTSGDKLPLYLTFTHDNACYTATLKDVTPMDEDHQDISACLDFEEI